MSRYIKITVRTTLAVLFVSNFSAHALSKQTPDITHAKTSCLEGTSYFRDHQDSNPPAFNTDISKNLANLIRVCSRYFENEKSAKSHFHYGRVLLIGGKRERGTRLIETAHTQGHPAAAYFLAETIETGILLKKRQRQMLVYLQQAAERSHPDAIAALAFYGSSLGDKHTKPYLADLKLSRSLKRAANELLKSIRLGSSLGEFYAYLFLIRGVTVGNLTREELHKSLLQKKNREYLLYDSSRNLLKLKSLRNHEKISTNVKHIKISAKYEYVLAIHHMFYIYRTGEYIKNNIDISNKYYCRLSEQSRSRLRATTKFNSLPTCTSLPSK